MPERPDQADPIKLLEDQEDARLAAEALEAHRPSGEASIPLAVLMEEIEGG